MVRRVEADVPRKQEQFAWRPPVVRHRGRRHCLVSSIGAGYVDVFDDDAIDVEHSCKQEWRNSSNMLKKAPVKVHIKRNKFSFMNY